MDATADPMIRLDVLDDSESGKQMARVDGRSIVVNIRHLVPLLTEIEDLKARQHNLETNAPAVAKAYAVAEGTPADAKLQKKGDPHNAEEG